MLRRFRDSVSLAFAPFLPLCWKKETHSFCDLVLVNDFLEFEVATDSR